MTHPTARVLIVGATSGIAAAAAREFAGRGVPLTLAARNQDAAGHLAEELQGQVVLVSAWGLSRRSSFAGKCPMTDWD